MIPFVILLLIPIILQHLHIKGFDYQEKNRAALRFFFVWLTVLVMLRHESVGRDTTVYTRYYSAFCEMDWRNLNHGSLEFGFVVFNKLVSLLSKEPQFFLAMTGLVVSAMIYPTYKRLCVDTSLSIVLFGFMSTFVMMFSGIRQMLAVAIGFIAYEFVRRKKVIPFLLTVWLASTVHTSAFMLLVMYPLYHARITKRSLFLVIPVLFLVYIYNQQVFSVLSLILERYTKYEAEISSTGAYSTLILFVILTAFSFLIPDETRMDSELVGLRNFMLFALMLQMFAPLHMLAMRMNYYYIIFIPLLVPKIISCKSKKWIQVAVLGRHIMVLFFLLYFFFSASSGSALDVYPYHFFWENV